MRSRIFGLVASVVIIVFAMIALILVGKITEIGGSGYSWEYIPPVIMGASGIALLIYWVRRIEAKK